MNEAQTQITDQIIDQIIDQQTNFEIKGFQPSTVIIGKREYEIMVESHRRNPMLIHGKPSEDGMMIFGMNIVYDHKSESRCDVVLNAGFINYRMIKRKGHPMITRDGE